MKSNISELLKDYKNGKMIILLDDEDRENEGDLIIAAEKVRPEDINFMATYGRGLICLTLTEERCKQLKLPLMVNDNQDQNSTNFTVSIEAASGVSTGISAADRAKTVLDAVAKNASEKDIVQPGHIFPLMAKKGGVLTRAGHTEAGCDLARLAGFEPASVIVEILNDDGTMARRPDLEIFAKKHNIKWGTIEDLISYIATHEKTIKKISEQDFDSVYGNFKLIEYFDENSELVHKALVSGKITDNTNVRVHMQHCEKDILGKKTNSLSAQTALKYLGENGGVFVLLNKANQSKDDIKTYGVGAQILADIGVKNIKLIGDKVKLNALRGFGLEIVDYINLKNS